MKEQKGRIDLHLSTAIRRLRALPMAKTGARGHTAARQWTTLRNARLRKIAPEEDQVFEENGRWWTLVTSYRLRPLPRELFNHAAGHSRRYPSHFRAKVAHADELGLPPVLNKFAMHQEGARAS